MRAVPFPSASARPRTYEKTVCPAQTKDRFTSIVPPAGGAFHTPIPYPAEKPCAIGSLFKGTCVVPLRYCIPLLSASEAKTGAPHCSPAQYGHFRIYSQPAAAQTSHRHAESIVTLRSSSDRQLSQNRLKEKGPPAHRKHRRAFHPAAPKSGSCY